MKKPISFHLRHLTEILILVWSITFFLPGGACNAQGSIDHSFNPGDIGFGNGDGANNILWTTTLQPNGKTIIGGWFTFYNSTYINRIICLDTNGNPDSLFNPGAGANGPIYTSVLQPDGKIIIGGQFTSFNNTVRENVARLNSDGTIDFSFDPAAGANSEVRTITIQPDGKIVIGGEFTAYNGIARNRIARLNADGSLDPTFNPGMGADSTIFTMTIQPDGKFIIGGAFTAFNGTGRNRIARLKTNGTLDTIFSPGTGANGMVYATSLQSDGKIIIGGSFTFFNGTTSDRIVRLNANGTIDNSFNIGTGANGYLRTISRQADGKIIIGGNFSSYNGTGRNRIARLNTNGTVDTTFTPGSGADHIVSTTVLQPDGKIIVGGIFATFNGTHKKRIARLNVDGTLDSTFNHGSGANGYLRTIAHQTDGNLIIGGAFTAFNGTGRNRIARLKTNGTLDTTFNPGTGVDGVVITTALQPNGKIIIGGEFYFFNGIARNRIARLNADGSLDNTFNPGTGSDGAIMTSTIQPDGKIIIGGAFLSFDGVGRNFIARLNANGTLDPAFYNMLWGVDSIILTTTLQPDGKIIIGGEFTSYQGIARNHIARLNTDGSLDNTFNPGTGSDGTIMTCTIQPDGKIIIGGTFLSFDGVGRNRIARLNTNGTLDTTFNPGTGVFGFVSTTVLQPDGKIIVGGNFTFYNGMARNCIARLNTDGSLDYSFNPGTGSNGNVWASALQPDGKIVIGGEFTSYNGIGRNRIARILNCTSSLSYDVQTACNSFTWIDGNTYTSSNNTAVYNIPGGAANGCDSVIMLNLTINTPSVAISALGNVSFCQGDSVTLSAQSNAITHQWYRTGVAVPNATGISYVAKTYGKYRCVGVDSTGCADTSNTIVVTVPCILPEPPIERITPDNHVFQPAIISPNPVNNNVSLKFTSTVPNGFVVELSDVYGKTVWRQHFQNTGKEYSFSLPDHITNGMYICRITSPEIEQVSKILVER